MPSTMTAPSHAANQPCGGRLFPNSCPGTDGKYMECCAQAIASTPPCVPDLDYLKATPTVPICPNVAWRYAKVRFSHQFMRVCVGEGCRLGLLVLQRMPPQLHANC